MHRVDIRWIEGEHQVMILALVLAVVGVAGVVLGGADDSPGLQGIGVLLVAAAAVVAVRHRRRAAED